MKYLKQIAWAVTLGVMSMGGSICLRTKRRPYRRRSHNAFTGGS
jgi:hypothetical protein